MGGTTSSPIQPTPVPQQSPSIPASQVTGGARSVFSSSSVPSPPSPDITPGNEQSAEKIPIESLSEDSGPGTFEELHRKCKDVFPVPFEGAKLVINKGLSNHFQISHNLTMSALQPSGYKFGCTYVGNKQFSPTEIGGDKLLCEEMLPHSWLAGWDYFRAYPVLMGEVDPSGNLNANIVHHLTRSIRCKFVSQVQNHKWVATQITTDYKGKDCVATLTVGNPDIVNESGVLVAQYLQNVTKRCALGVEMLYQYGATVPGNQIGVYTMAGRYAADKWQVSGSLTLLAGGLHVCYYQKANDSLQIGVELEGSLRTQECTATIGYQLELPKADLTFRGQVDSNWCVGAVMEKKLPPLPFTFALSAFANHVKGTYRFGVGLIVG